MTPSQIDLPAEARSNLPPQDPFALFAAWFDAARASEPNDPEAMALATATPTGAPSLRMVLLKGYDANGFVFYTNAQSRKGREIAANPQAALLFHWKSLRRQIRIEGALQEVSAAEADAYFHSRSRLSQLGSAASDQSRPLAERQDYLTRVDELAERYPTGDVPRPPHWTGFRLTPEAIEFWLDRPGRLHDRRRFTRRVDGGWDSTLLYP
ncbi:pyridoxamine 5'-phosphate oxidase [Qipengyuania sediminis]|uniref:pyridoxamine 5'-phosphate oxidase n=1 Tax=Qipengyuania sediminis TaxID=1532023 RepID=UPI001F0FFC23|nr:pyridoxamine 5'-phosphate oxidase [Qipengyuania sediminis]